jgi:hypothetical protein
MAQDKEQSPSPAQLADLSALADGSLEPSRRVAVERWIAGSPELRSLYEREATAVQVLRRAATERAPAELRVRVDSQRTSRAAGRRRRPAYAVLAAGLAAVVAALALLLPGGAPGSPSVSQAAQLALRGASGPAPTPDPGDPQMKLNQRVDGLYFPNWAGTLGWRPAGVRSDRLAGRQAVTVYYERYGASVAYTIVGTPALTKPSTRVTSFGGLALQALSLRGRTVVTWRRAGHTCILSASGVPTRILERLADWPAARISE